MEEVGCSMDIVVRKESCVNISLLRDSTDGLEEALDSSLCIK